MCPCTFIKLLKGKGQRGWQSPGWHREPPKGESSSLRAKAGQPSQSSPAEPMGVYIPLHRAGEAGMPFLSGVPCLSLDEAQKGTAISFVNSAPNGTLFEVSIGKMWFSATGQSTGNRVFPCRVWLLMYVMGYLLAVSLACL